MVEVKMKRNLLIIISIVLCLILNMMFKPTIVKADELNLEETSLKENEDNVNNDEQEDNEIEQELELYEESTNETKSEVPTEVNGTITTFTNSYTPKVRNIEVSKIWYDNNNEYEVRVKEVNVSVIADGEVITTITLNDDNDWTETLKDLPVYKNGKEIKYEVSEFEVEHYKVIIEENEKGFVIYNFYDAQGGETPPSDDTPKTGDTIKASVISLIISSFVFTTSIYIKKKNN